MMHAIQERVIREIEEMRAEIVITTQGLVKIPSVVGTEAQAQAYIESLYGTIGLDVTRFQALLRGNGIRRNKRGCCQDMPCAPDARRSVS